MIPAAWLRIPYYAELDPYLPREPRWRLVLRAWLANWRLTWAQIDEMERQRGW